MQTSTAGDLIIAQMDRLQEKTDRNSEESEPSSRCEFCGGIIPFVVNDDFLHCKDCCHSKLLAGIQYDIENINQTLLKIGIPPKFVGTGIKPQEWTKKYILKNSGRRGFFIHGSTGVGKTTALALFVEMYFKEMIYRRNKKFLWRFENCASLIMTVQRSFKRDGEEAYNLLDVIAQVPFLAIDDLGATKPTDFVRQAIYYIINERESYLRPTFITSNFSLEELNDQFDPRISSRIAGMCDVVEMKGNDRRLS